jgi:hypothetical protein
MPRKRELQTLAECIRFEFSEGVARHVMEAVRLELLNNSKPARQLADEWGCVTESYVNKIRNHALRNHRAKENAFAGGKLLLLIITQLEITKPTFCPGFRRAVAGLSRAIEYARVNQPRSHQGIQTWPLTESTLISLHCWDAAEEFGSRERHQRVLREVDRRVTYLNAECIKAGLSMIAPNIETPDKLASLISEWHPYWTTCRNALNLTKMEWVQQALFSDPPWCPDRGKLLIAQEPVPGAREVFGGPR